MYAKQTIIINKSGLHARPASDFIIEAKKYESKVTIRKTGKNSALAGKDSASTGRDSALAGKDSASTGKDSALAEEGSAPVNAKSIARLLGEGIAKGDVIEIAAEGPDEQTAVDSLVALVETSFGE